MSEFAQASSDSADDVSRKLEKLSPTNEDLRSLGEIIRDTRNLTAAQVEQILEHQRLTGVRFGEAAIALEFATPDDVLQALAKQFNYAYGTADSQRSSPELVSYNQPFSYQSEAIRAIRAQILMGQLNTDGDTSLRPKKALAVVSPTSGDGKTFFAANLAISLAQLGGRTLIVDADLRGPRMHEVFQVNPGAGLVGLLSGRRGDRVLKAVDGISNLFLLSAGGVPPNPLELVEGVTFGLLLRELLTKFDHIVVDTPAAQYGADATVLAARCGQSLVVARRHVAKVDLMQDLVSSLAAANSRIAGFVMNEF